MDANAVLTLADLVQTYWKRTLYERYAARAKPEAKTVRKHETTEDTKILVLSRKVNEEVVITHRETGEQVVIRVLEYGGRNGIRLGFDAADAEYEINRREVEDRKNQTPMEE